MERQRRRDRLQAMSQDAVAAVPSLAPHAARASARLTDSRHDLSSHTDKAAQEPAALADVCGSRLRAANTRLTAAVEQRRMPIDSTNPARPYRAPLFADTGSTPPPTVCIACPAALWYEVGGPVAFCTVMKITTSPHPVTPITRCDGQRAAVAKLGVEMRRPGATR